jgi:hypothetical protein
MPKIFAHNDLGCTPKPQTIPPENVMPRFPVTAAIRHGFPHTFGPVLTAAFGLRLACRKTLVLRHHQRRIYAGTDAHPQMAADGTTACSIPITPPREGEVFSTFGELSLQGKVQKRIVRAAARGNARLCPPSRSHARAGVRFIQRHVYYVVAGQVQFGRIVFEPLHQHPHQLRPGDIIRHTIRH